jgi:hypothetical protein
MKKILLLSLMLLVFSSLNINAQTQQIIFHKITDSEEITVIKNEKEQVWVLLKKGVKEDTIWQNDFGRMHVQKIEDIQFFKDKFAMIYYGFNIVVVLFLEWDGMTWNNGMAEVLASEYDIYPCKVEIVNYGAVRVKQKGDINFIKYDTETGIEISRTVEKE